MGSTGFAVEMCREALVLALTISMPLLGIGLVVGLLVSLFQALTQIQEQTLAFIPKVLAMGVALFLLLTRLLSLITAYMREVLGDLGQATLL